MRRASVFITFVLVLIAAFAWQAGARVGQGGGAPASPCADVTGDGKLDISDPIHLLAYLFTGGPPPAPCEAQSGSAAVNVSFDPAGSGLASLNVQAALLELDRKVQGLTAINSALQVRVDLLENLNPSAKAIEIEMVQIPAGSFLMGSPENEAGRGSDEALHPVNITRPFLLASNLVTQAQFEAVAGYDPSYYLGCPDCPVEMGHWYQVRDFLQKLTARQRIAGKVGPKDFYRLPTEAEWEYACRAGTTTRFSFGDVKECVNDSSFCAAAAEHMWWVGNVNFAEGPKPVARKKPNPWGLYDLHGNAFEICSDWYGPYPVGEVDDPTGPASGTAHVLRGGNYATALSSCRSAARTYMPVNAGGYGIRLVLEVVP